MHYLRGELKQARRIAKKHKSSSSVPRIKKRFSELLTQIQDVMNCKLLVTDSTETESVTGPTLSMVVKDKAIEIEYQNIDKVTVSYYMMDIEFLFSSNPFMSQGEKKTGMEQFS